MELLKSELRNKHFFMIRHGETVANAEGYAAGSFDTPLTERGRGQAEAIKPLLRQLKCKPKNIVHSTLSRARDTASILNEELSLPLVEADGISERSFGDWMGQSFESVFQRIQSGEVPPNGESNVVFVNRALKGLSQILEKYNLPLVVTHGGLFDAVAWAFDFNIEDIKNCQLYEFVPCSDRGDFPWLIQHYTLVDDERVIISKANHLLIPTAQIS